MVSDSIFIEGSLTKVYSLNTVIVGGGLAGLNAALHLYDRGQTDLAILIDGEAGSTSQIARSDQQSYYKLASFGNDADSPYRMARSLQSANTNDGDLALVEAALSSQCFYHVAELGLAFPQNEYGEYIGQGTGGENARRSFSCGPDTAGQMHAALLREVKKRQIPVLYGYQVVKLFTDEKRCKVVGLLALCYDGIRERHQRYQLFNCTNIVLATGGPGGLFYSEGYPAAHTGCLGLALEAGARAINLTEFQYGICAVGLSLTMNGAYQTALPRYISVDEDGKAREFLLSYFKDPAALYRLIQRKGEQWAFDAKKVREDGTSLLDLLLYHEITMKKRRVYMDYRINPTGYENEQTPAQRLQAASPFAYQTLLEKGFTDDTMIVEVHPAIAQHNGGLSVNYFWESNLSHLFPIGEAAGTHGSFTPMGASINASQVSGYRAAQHIVKPYPEAPMEIDAFVECIREGYHERIEMTEDFIRHLQRKIGEEEAISIRSVRQEIGKRMDKACGLFRDASRIEHELQNAKLSLQNLATFFLPHAMLDLTLFFKNYDLLICQIAFLSAMLDYDRAGGKSRGSYLLYDAQGSLPHPKLEEMFRFAVADSTLAGQVQELWYDAKQLGCTIQWRPVRPIPKS